MSLTFPGVAEGEVNRIRWDLLSQNLRFDFPAVPSDKWWDLHGVFSINSGNLAAVGSEGAVTVAYDMNPAHTNRIVMGHLSDGNWAHQCGWRAEFVLTGSFYRPKITFINGGPNVPADANLTFVILAETPRPVV